LRRKWSKDSDCVRARWLQVYQDEYIIHISAFHNQMTDVFRNFRPVSSAKSS
jgi:hypothetical protein